MIGDGGASSPGLLALGLANPNAAATATVNAFDALLVAARSHSAVRTVRQPTRP